MAITAAERTQIIELTSLMFNAAPGAFYLTQIVALYEGNGRNLQTLANILGSTGVYQSLNPNFQTAAEFAADLLATVGLTGDQFATDFIVTRFNAGQSKASIAFQAFSALNSVGTGDAAQYQAAKATLLNKTAVAEYYSVTKEGTATDLLTLQGVVGGVTDVAASVDAAKAAVDALVITGLVFPLTTGIDTIVGTAGNDTIVAVLDDAGGTGTFTNLDSIDGGAGTADTLQLDDLDVLGSAFPAGVSLKNVETAVVRGAGVVNVDTSGAIGLTKVQVTQATAATVSAAATTAVEVTGATGNITVDGGSSQTVTSSTAGAVITLGATTVGKGAISATHGNQAAAAISVDGGTTVSVTAAGVTTGTVNIGQGGTAADQASGAVSVTSTGAASVAGVDAARGTISVTGGTTVNVNQTATSSSAAAAADLVGATVTQSAVNVTGGAATTSVTVLESAPVAEKLAVAAVAGANETQTVTFGAMTATQTLAINGLTFTAAKALTAAQVAAAFANLANGTTQGSAPAANGVYSGTFNTIGFTTGSVVAAGAASTVVFTSTAKANEAALTIAGTAVGTSVTATVDGAGAVTGVTGVLGVAGGAVTVNGAITGADVLTTVTLGGYGATTVASDALNTLTLANSAAAVTVTNAAATTLALSLSGVTGGAAVTLPTYTTLNVAATGANSVAVITAAAATAVSVSGDKALDLSGSALAALKTLTITGAAGVKFDASGATVTSVDASGTSGNNTLTVDASKATFTGGSGADTVTLKAGAAVTKAVALGAGDDSVTLAAGTVALTGNVSGGDGTDILAMAAADATTASATVTFETKIDAFEKLSLAVAATDTVDLANVDDINYVISAGNTVVLNLDGMTSGGTLELTGTAVLTDVDLAPATGTADVFNLVTKVGAADLNFGNLDLSGIETVNLTATDTSTTAAINSAGLLLTDAALKTVTITGNSHVGLGTTSIVLTSVDGSAMTGNLIAGTNGTLAQTITGGSGNDTLTATGNGNTLIGGAGTDTLINSGSLNTLTGGAGADTFNAAFAVANVNSYASITDLAAGDKIQFTAASVTFQNGSVTLAPTAVFQDFANAAIATTADGQVAWFQFGGDTYIVEEVAGGDATAFTNGNDIIVKVVGLVDLTAASFSSSAHTLLVV